VRAVLVIHVVLAIFLIGPLVAAGNQVARELRGGSAGTVRLLARTVTVYGWASLLVGIVGFGLVRDRFSFSDGWLLASIVLFVVASVLVLALLVPLLRRATAAAPAGTGSAGSATGAAAGDTGGDTARRRTRRRRQPLLRRDRGPDDLEARRLSLPRPAWRHC
jgi:uncharacterized membrane protein